MAYADGVTNLCINGESSTYKGTEPITITWNYAGSHSGFMQGPYVTLTINQSTVYFETHNIAFGETSFTFPAETIAAIKENVKTYGENKVFISVYTWGYDSSFTLIESMPSSVTLEYASVFLYPPFMVALNGGVSYQGTAPVLTWWAPLEQWEGELSDGPYYGIRINDGGTWESDIQLPFEDTVYQFPEEIVEQILNNSGQAEITMYTWGISANGTETIVSEDSNKVLFVYYIPPVPNARACYVKYCVGDSWETSAVSYYDGNEWQACAVYYFNGTSWQLCSF